VPASLSDRNLGKKNERNHMRHRYRFLLYSAYTCMGFTLLKVVISAYTGTG